MLSNLRYRLCKNGTGVLTGRTAEVFREYLPVQFQNAKHGSTVIVEGNGRTLYLPIEDGICNLPQNALLGEVKITVALFDDTTAYERWECEGLLVNKISEDLFVAVPNDMEMPERFVLLQENFEVLKEYCLRLEERLESLEEKFNSVIEAYDIF